MPKLAVNDAVLSYQRSVRRKAFARLIMPEAYLAARGFETCLQELERIFGRSLSDSPAIADVQLRALRAHDERAALPKLAAIPSLVLSGRLDPIRLARRQRGSVPRDWERGAPSLGRRIPCAADPARRGRE